MAHRTDSLRKTFVPFGVTAVAWLALSILLCLKADAPEAQRSVNWLIGLWAVSVLDLFALALTGAAALELASGTSEKRGALLIQASTWGLIKLACLGVFGLILFSRGSTIPGTGLLSGLATMIIVPLFGGLWWSQRELKNA